MTKKRLSARVFVSFFSSTVMALVFGALWLGIQSFELFQEGLEARLGRTTAVTVRLPSTYFRITMLRNEFHYLQTASSACPQMVPRGTKLEKGEECAGLVRAYERARRPIRPLKLLGMFLFNGIAALFLSRFLRRDRGGRTAWLRSQVTILVLLTATLLGSKALLLLTALPAQLMPVAFVPLLSAYFLGKRHAYGVAFLAAILAASLVNFEVEVMLMQLVTSVAAVLALRPRHRAQVLVRAGGMAAWVAVTASVVVTLLFAGTLDIHDDILEHFDPRYSLWLASLCSGLGSGLLAWIALPLVAPMMGEVSRNKLLDLQELDRPLLQRLRERAPATWEHSRTMANLAEAAAHAIGGNALLVRVGAYYHDVGKSSKPEYFIENQSGGENPHDQMEPVESARAIFHHVSEGVRLLRQEGLPEDVIEFTYSHHGTSLLEYFWHKTMSAENPEGFTERDFTYPGHKPSTRETGILMLVDAIEAAARTVDQPEKSKFENLVQRIVFSKLSQAQLDESGLTVTDLRLVANTLVDTLVSMYHARIKYPWQTETTGMIATTGGTPPPVAEMPTPVPTPVPAP
ncbi:MAG TPA: HDIG domain-containing protein, partial [Polyangia bacterium]|nr:HDIG domain-containing protein [Polyangia bacterium]